MATALPTALKIRQLPIADGNGQTALDGIGAIHKTIKKTFIKEKYRKKHMFFSKFGISKKYMHKNAIKIVWGSKILHLLPKIWLFWGKEN